MESDDKKIIEIDIKEALLLFEASFVKFTKKPSKANMDQLINDGNQYKELWINLMSERSPSEEPNDISEILELDNRNIDYEKLDQINTAKKDSSGFDKYLVQNFDKTSIEADTNNSDDIEARNWYSSDLSRGKVTNSGLMSVTDMRNSFPEISGSKDHLPSNVSYKPKVLARTAHSNDKEQFALVTKRHNVPSMIASSQDVGAGTFNRPREIESAEVSIDKIIPPSISSHLEQHLNYHGNDPDKYTFIEGFQIRNDFIKQIERDGIIKPIDVTSAIKTLSDGATEVLTEKFEIVDGISRYFAALYLGIKTIPIRQAQYRILDQHNFVAHHITASDLIKSKKDNVERNANRRWYFKNPDVTHRDLILGAMEKSTHPRWRNINIDDYVANIKHAWRTKRSDFQSMLEDAFNNGHFHYHHNDTRSIYPSSEFTSSEDLNIADIEYLLSTFTLPHERIQFDNPDYYFAFQDSYYMKPKGDIALQPFNRPKFNDEGHHLARIWRDVLIYSPDYVTIRSATTNVDCLNTTAIPDNPRWVISNEMPSISNQTLIKFTEKLDPEMAKNIKIFNEENMKLAFKNA